MKTRGNMICATLVGLGLAAGAVGAGTAEFEWETYLNPNKPLDIAAYDGKLWLASASGGVTVFDIADSSFSTIHRRPGELASNRLTGVLPDGNGGLWFATSASGVSVLDTGSSSWELLTGFEGLPTDTVSVMARWSDSVWIGTPSGFAVFKRGTLVGRCNVRLPPDVRCPLDSHTIRAIAPLGDGAYLGTPAGVAWYDGEIATPIGDPGSPGLIVDLVFYEGAPWALVSDGAYRWEADSSEWARDGLQSVAGLRGLSLIDGVLYAVSSSGVYVRSDGLWSRLGDDLNAMGIVKSESGDLWAAATGGLHLLSDGLWRRMVAAGPVFDDARSIAVGRDGEVWFTGPSWCTSFDGEDWPAISFHETNDRLQACDTHGILVDSSNRVWFGHCCRVSAPDSCLADRLTRSVGSWRWRRFDTTNIWRVAEGGGSLWLAARFTGLYRIRDGDQDPENILAGPGLMSSMLLASVAYDSGRGLWIGHRQTGVDLYRNGNWQDPGNWSHIGSNQGLLGDNVRKVLVKGAEVWVGTLNGVSVVDPSSMTVVRNYTVGPGGVDDRISGVSGLAVDGSGDVWVSTDGNGIYLIKGDGSILSFNTCNSPLSDDRAKDVAYDEFSDTIWISTFRGINAVVRSASSGQAGETSLYVYPNPYCPVGCDGADGGPLRVGGLSGSVSGEVVDLRGQIVARFFSAGDGDIIWDGTDASGSPAGSGLYLIVARSGSQAFRVKFALIR